MNGWSGTAGLLCAVSVIGLAFARAETGRSEPRAESHMQSRTSKTRVAAAQPRNRTLDWKISEPREVLRRVDHSLAELEQIAKTVL